MPGDGFAFPVRSVPMSISLARSHWLRSRDTDARTRRVRTAGIAVCIWAAQRQFPCRADHTWPRLADTFPAVAQDALQLLDLALGIR